VKIAVGEFGWIADSWRSTPQLDRALVIAKERPIGPADAEACRDRVEHGLVNLSEGFEALLCRGDL
jgi:hypothetical protein